MIRALIPLAAGLSAAALAAPASGENGWHSYLLGPRKQLVTPVSVLATSGRVSDAREILQPGGEAARLEHSVGSPDTYLELDFGREVVGALEIGYARAEPIVPLVRVTFSESRAHLREWSDYSRWNEADDHFPAANGERWVNRRACDGPEVCSDGVRAFRYVRIALPSWTEGSVEIDYVRLRFSPPLTTPSDYRGWFLSSDPELNRIWYASVYTVQIVTDRFLPDRLDPRDCWLPALAGKLVLLDGAKHDRCPYVADLAVSQLTEFISHGRAERSAVVLEALAQAQSGDGYVPPSPLLNGGLRLFDYPSWWVVAVYDYALYTGDLDLVRRSWPTLRRLLDAWYPSVTNQRGLLSNSFGAADYNFVPRDGDEVTYYNATYVRALLAAARLADALGRPGPAREWRSRAERVAAAVDRFLWDAAGVYRDTTRSIVHPLDGNVFAVLAGIANKARADRALTYFHRCCLLPWGIAIADSELWSGGAWGPGASRRVYPFLSYFDVLARFSRGRDSEALDEIRRVWGWMIDPARDAGGTMWEAIGDGKPDGFQGAATSLAHGWSTGAAPALTTKVLGIEPTDFGFVRFDAVPHPSDLRWAAGQVPTPYGPIRFSWRRDQGIFRATLRVPAGTRARLGIPRFRPAVTLRIDGERVQETHTSDYIFIDLAGGRTYTARAAASSDEE